MNIIMPGNASAALAIATANPKTSASTGAGQPVAEVADKVTLGSSVIEPATYPDPRASAATSQSDLSVLLEQSNQQAQAIVNLIMPLVQQQGLIFGKVVSGAQHVYADAADIQKAKAAIAEDGEFGVMQVASRILSFAKAAIGNDPAKLDTIRAAVEKGFQQASDALGGTLPEISQKTHEAIFAELDRWGKEGIPSGDTVNLAATNKTVDTAAA